MNSLMTSLVGMHGPAAWQEMSRGLSATASQALPRPQDKSHMDGVKRIVNNGEMWKRVIASIVGSLVMGRDKK